MKGRLNDDLEATVLLLEQKYPFDTCRDHPKKWCFKYQVTNKHFDLTHPRLLVWAAAIVHSFFACCALLAHIKSVGTERDNDGAHSDHVKPLQGRTHHGDTPKASPIFCSTFDSSCFICLCRSNCGPPFAGRPTWCTPSSLWQLIWWLPLHATTLPPLRHATWASPWPGLQLPESLWACTTSTTRSKQFCPCLAWQHTLCGIFITTTSLHTRGLLQHLWS